MSAVRSAIVPAYLLLCILIGGSAQGIWTNALLQLVAIAILAWAALTRDPVQMPAAAKRLVLLAAAAIGLILLQLIPLPPALWTLLPGRDFVAEGYGLTGADLPWLPISLAPYETLATAMTLLPPLAVLAGMLRLRAFRDQGLVAALLLGALVSVVVGVLQVTTDDPSWYFYRFSNFGAAAGFFANSNHMAALMLVSVPFLAAAAADQWARTRDANARSLIGALGFGAAAVLGVGILVNGSLAILLLGAPVAAATLLMVMRWSGARLRRGFLLVTLLLIAGGLAIGLLVREGASPGNTVSVETRTDIWSVSAEATGDHWLTGSGIGTFPQIYRRYEDPATIDRTYVNHAHNDHLEVLLEAGIPAAILLIAFLAWWVTNAANAWRAADATYYRKAASIASATLLLHSLVDYPLRTAALSTLMAACLALLAEARGARRAKRPGELRPARHATL